MNQDRNRNVLRISVRTAAAHPLTYPNGVVWHAWERADAGLPEGTRRDRHWVREYRDAYREAFGPLADPALLDRCSRAAARVRGLLDDGASMAEIGAAADTAAELILFAIAKDPDGAPDLTDLLEAIADALTERPDTQFCVPHILIALALLLAKDGEPEVAMQLLDTTIQVLDSAFTQVDHCTVAGAWTLARLALATVHLRTGDRILSMVIARDALVRGRNGPASASYKWFLDRHYFRVFEFLGEINDSNAILTAINAPAENDTPGKDWILDPALWTLSA